MSRFGAERHWQVFTGTSVDSSTYTSNPYLAVDAATITVSYQTVNTSSSRLTLQGSNDQGMTSAIVNWSVITTLTSQGIYSIDPGVRWHRWQRHSLESLSTLHQQYWIS